MEVFIEQHTAYNKHTRKVGGAFSIYRTTLYLFYNMFIYRTTEYIQLSCQNVFPEAHFLMGVLGVL